MAIMDIFVGRCGIGVLEKGVRFAKRALRHLLYLCIYVFTLRTLSRVSYVSETPIGTCRMLGHVSFMGK